MAKSKRNRRAKNKIEGSTEGALVNVDSSSEPAIVIQQTSQTSRVRLARAGLLSAELEEVIEIIARDRVYRMLAARNRRVLIAPVEADGEQTHS